MGEVWVCGGIVSTRPGRAEVKSERDDKGHCCLCVIFIGQAACVPPYAQFRGSPYAPREQCRYWHSARVIISSGFGQLLVLHPGYIRWERKVE